MAQMPESDFASFLDLDLDLAFYDADKQQGQQSQPHLHNVPSQLSASADQPNHHNQAFDFSLPIDVQFTMAQQQQHHQHSLQSVIPPTPNSVEMHSDTAQYLHHLEAQQRAMLDQYQVKNQQVCAMSCLFEF